MKDFPLDKYHYYFDEKNKRVIATTTFAGRTVRGVAKCADADNFDMTKGKELAAYRCNLKVAEKRSARAKKKKAEAAAAYNQAYLDFIKMRDYATDAADAEIEARWKVIHFLEDLK